MCLFCILVTIRFTHCQVIEKEEDWIKDLFTNIYYVLVDKKYEDKYKSLDHKMKLYKLYTHTKSYKGMYIFHGLELGYDMEISIYCLLNMAKGVTIVIFMPSFSPSTYRRQLSRQWSILAIIW